MFIFQIMIGTFLGIVCAMLILWCSCNTKFGMRLYIKMAMKWFKKYNDAFDEFYDRLISVNEEES